MQALPVQPQISTKLGIGSRLFRDSGPLPFSEVYSIEHAKAPALKTSDIPSTYSNAVLAHEPIDGAVWGDLR